MKKINTLLLLCFLAFSWQAFAQVTTYPFAEGFEGATFPPTGWTMDTLSGNSSWTQAATNNNSSISARTGSSLALFYSGNYNGDEVVLSTPAMNLTSLTTPELVVYNTQVDWGGDQDTLGVFYKTSATGTWTYLTSFTGTVGAWNEIKLTLPNPSNDYYIGFRAFGDWGYGVTLDDFQVREQPTCTPPSADAASSILANSAQVNWTENGTATSWRVEWDTAGYAAGTARNSVVVVTDTFLSITGLMAQTGYDWNVQALCSPTDSSAFVPGSFSTACNAVSTFPYSENFDGSLTNNVWDCWTVINADNDGETWEQTSTYITPRSAPWTAHGMGNQNDHLITPQLSLPAGITMRMKVWDIVESATQPNDYSILVSTTGTAIADFTDTLASYTVTNTAWTERTVDLSAYTGQTIYISLWQSFSNSSFWGFGLDDFVVEQTPACLAATANPANNLTATTATLDWIENGTATSWRVEWDTAGYAAGTARNSVVVNTDTFLNVTGLLAQTNYDWGVRTLCSPTDSSALVTGSFVTPCAAITTLPYSEDFSTFVPSCWDEADDGSIATGPQNIGSGVWTNQTGGAGFGTTARINLYTTNRSDWLISPAIDLTGGPFELVVDAAVTNWNSTTVPDNMGSDDSVQVAISTDNGLTWTSIYVWDVNNQPTVVPSPYIINLSAYSGTVIFGILATDGPVNDIEDYDFHIGNFEVRTPPSCPAATANTGTNSLTATAAEVSWVENGTATQWEVEWDTSGYVLGTGNSIIVNTDTFTTITGLTAQSTYDWYVRAICAVGDTSAWTTVRSFLTPCATAVAPFFDGFENHAVISGMNGSYTCWTATRQNTTNDWNVDASGSTPSTGTGPSGPFAGSQYIFLEASGGTAGAEAEFISPLIDITGLTTPTVEFYYHMFGDNRGGMGNLYVDLIDGGVTTTIDSIINEKQTAQTDPWLKRSVSFAATSGTVQISLRATRGTLSQYGDISVDEFSVVEAPAPYYPIGTINTEDATTGVADSLGVNCSISGTVVGVDRRGGGYEIAIIDMSSGFQEGITLFDFNDLPNYTNPTEGDSLFITGDVSQFNGLIQFNPDSIEVISTGNSIPTPNVVSTLDETTESKWLNMPGQWVSLSTSGSFSSNISLTNGTDTITMRIDSDTDVNDSLNSLGAIIPGDTICGLLGIGGQFDNSSPFTEGYQIFPMRWSDLTICRLYVAPYYPIGTINTEDATTGVADSLGVNCAISGTVVGVNRRGTGYEIAVIDMSSGFQEGITLFDFNGFASYASPIEGDSLYITGDVSQFNGLIQFSPDSIEVLSTGNAIPTPIVVTTLDETTESKWLSIPTNYVALNTSGSGSSNVDLTNGVDTITMRIDSDTDINDSLNASNPIAIGDTICGLFGIGGQFDNSSPFTDGYQVFPMRWSDLTICRNTTGIDNVENTSEFMLVPNPSNGTFEIQSNGFNNSTINISIRDVSGRVVASEFVNNATGNFRKSFDFNGQAKGIYFITIFDGEDVINNKLILQ